MITDPIADMLTRIRNAVARRFLTTKIPASRFKEDIAKILVKNGWLEKYELVSSDDEHPYLLITLKYYQQRPVIRDLQRISKPGQRIHVNNAELNKKYFSRFETVVVSTSKGLMTSTEAHFAKLGGEVLFKIW